MLDFSPCGKYVASISIDSTAKVWECSSGKIIHSVKVWDEWGWSVRWIPRDSIRTVNENCLKPFEGQLSQEMNEVMEESEGEEETNDEDSEEFLDEQFEEEEMTKEEVKEYVELESRECDSEDLILCGTFHHLFLFSSTLQPFARLPYLVTDHHVPLPPVMQHMRRLSLLEYIPELSLAIVGSQGMAVVVLVRIMRFSHATLTTGVSKQESIS